MSLIYPDDSIQLLGLAITNARYISFIEKACELIDNGTYGNDSVLEWTRPEDSSGQTESPVYKLEVDHDMQILLYAETWD